MKSLVESLFDKKGTLDRDVYKYHPHTKKELINCINKELDLQGPDANLNIIDVSKITNMYMLFYELNITNIDISKWDVSGVNNMEGMFVGCEKFNCDLSRWDVSGVKNMSGMFDGCKEFNSDLSRWDVSNLEYAIYMFFNCKKFNSDLSDWNVYKLQQMDTTGLSNMNNMFKGCESLKKIPSWYK